MEYTDYYTYNEFNQLVKVSVDNIMTGETGEKTYAYDKDGNQISETSTIDNSQTLYTYDAANRLKIVTGKTGEVIDYVQENKYNGYGQRVRKTETVGINTDVTKYFYDGSQILYTKDSEDALSSFNMIGVEDNIIATARPGDGETETPSFYSYIRESTTNVVGTDGISEVSYTYDTFGKTNAYEKNANEPFYNEICFAAGVYDKTTGLYNLNARYYNPENSTFMSQDTYRGSRSRTETLNPIEKINVGDYVWSEDPATNSKALKKVNKIFVREKDSIIRLSINGEVIETTDEHPFYVEGKGFVSAKLLEVGDEVRLKDGTTATVEENETVNLDKPIKVYNFEVEDYHTYYVSEQEVLVHNSCNHTVATTAKNTSDIRYSPINPGPLEEEVTLSFRGASYSEKILQEDTVMYRVYGGEAKKIGSYFSKTIQQGGIQSKLDLALLPEWGNSAEHIAKVIIPKGTKIYEGAAAPQTIRDVAGNVRFTLHGGGNQVYIPKVDERWFY